MWRSRVCSSDGRNLPHCHDDGYFLSCSNSQTLLPITLCYAASMPPRAGPVNNLADQISWLLRVRPFIPPSPRNEPAANDHGLSRGCPPNSAETRPLPRANASSATVAGPDAVAGQPHVADHGATLGRVTEPRADSRGGHDFAAALGLQDMVVLKSPLAPSQKPQSVTRLSKIATGKTRAAPQTCPG
jgi:hypothetical protein